MNLFCYLQEVIGWKALKAKRTRTNEKVVPLSGTMVVSALIRDIITTVEYLNKVSELI